MAAYIDKVKKPYVIRKKSFPFLKLVRYEGVWYNSAYGMFSIRATTHREAIDKMYIEQGKMFSGA